MLGGLQKLDIVGESVTWDDEQIGFLEDPQTVLLCTTDEDFENNEQSLSFKQDVLANLDSIKVALTNAGYSLGVNHD
jgi:hypothetical protein